MLKYTASGGAWPRSAAAALATACLAVLLAMWFWPGSPLPHYLTAFVFGCSLFTLYSLSLARANDVLPKAQTA